LLRGYTSNGDRDRPTPENRWQGLLTQQQRDRRNHYQGTAPYRLLPIRCRSTWAGSEPGFRPIRSDGSRGRLPDCRAWDPGVVWFWLIVARKGGRARPPQAGSDCLSHPQGHGIIHLVDQAGSEAVHHCRTVRPRQIGFQGFGKTIQSIIKSGLLLRGQGDGDGSVCHGSGSFGS